MDPYAPTPDERQMLMAQTLRGQQVLSANNQRANQFGNLAAIAELANNPDAARAAIAAHRQSQAQFKPVQLGQTGFSLPASGEFVENPIYSEQRITDRGEKRGTLAASMQARADAQAERLAAQKESQADRQAFQASQNEQARALRMTIAGIVGDRQAAAAAAKAEADAAKPSGKVLPATEARRLSDKEESALVFGDLAASFKPEFAGTPGLAGVENTLGKYSPVGLGDKYRDQSNWWQNYNDQKNRVRNLLFGSALTKTEQDAFDRANINEGMDPEEIARRLGQQRQAAARAYSKLKGNYGKAGYSVEGFSDMELPEAAVPGGALPSTAPVPPKGLVIPQGATYIGPAP